MQLPSKELLSEVLGYKVDTFLGINKNEIDYTFCKDENEGYIDTSINIYELAFKCQESAIVKGFDICPKMDSKGFYRLLTDDNIIGLKIEDKFIFSESISPCSSRVEAIFKAYEWILKEIKDK